MSTFNDAPYSFMNGVNRLTGPVNLSNVASYVWDSASSLECDSTQVNQQSEGAAGSSTYFYKLATTGGTPPQRAPAVPIVPVTPGTTSMTVTFLAPADGAKPASTYSILYGTTTAPTTPLPAQQLVSGLALYGTTVTGLTPGTTYYFKSVAKNAYGAKISAVSRGYTTSSGGGTPPSGAPTVPVVSGTPTSSSITVTFDVSGVTGSPPPSFSILFGTTTTPSAPAVATRVGGNTYTATAGGLLAGTTYYFKSVASNGNPPDAVSAVSTGIPTASAPPSGPLKTNVVVPFLIQGPRFGSTPGAWTGIDYFVNVDAVGATATLGTSNIGGQQVFAAMYSGTVGTPGDYSNGAMPPVPYAGGCFADQPFAWLSTTGGTGSIPNYSDTYLKGVQSALASNGRVSACWGGFYADILGLFGPYQPTGYPGTNPSASDVVKSFLYNNCGITAGNTNPLNWVRTNSTNTSNWTFYFQGLILDFENVGNSNPLNSYPYAVPGAPPAFPAQATNPTYAPYIAELASICTTFYSIAPTLFFGNAPVSLSLIADQGTTNICASNSALNTWYAFPTATVPPTVASYNTTASLALNAPEQMSYFDDVFVQFYNESADYSLGGQYFTNLLACWGYVALQAQKKNRKKTTINIGLAHGDIIPGKNNAGVYVESGQGPTPQLGNPPNTGSGAPYTYWYPQYATASPPNYTGTGGWPNTSPTLDPTNLAAAITGATAILQNMTQNLNLVPSDWCSGMGFWAGGRATTGAQSVYTKTDPISPGPVLPALQTYCWADADYPAPNPLWAGNVPIVNRLV